MAWYFRLHERPAVNLSGLMARCCLRGAYIQGVHSLFVEAESALAATELMDRMIADLVVYNAPLRGPFGDKKEAEFFAKKEFAVIVVKQKKMPALSPAV